MPGPAPQQPACQLGDEPSLWHTRFKFYLEQRPPRSILGVYRTVSAKPDAKNLPRGWKDAAARFRWTARAEAFDRDAAAAEEAARAAAASDAATDRAKLREERRKQQEADEFELAGLLIGKAREMLAAAIYASRSSRDGKGVEIKPSRWKMIDAARMVEIAVRLRRMSCRMPAVVEPEAVPNLDDLLYFESSGQLEQALPPGSVPPIPSNVHVKPPIVETNAQAGRRGAPSQPPLERPQPPRITRKGQ